MDDRLSGPPTFYSRKRKRLHLLEDASPELEHLTLPPINPPLDPHQQRLYQQNTLPPIRSSSPLSPSSSSDGRDSYRDHHRRPPPSDYYNNRALPSSSNYQGPSLSSSPIRPISGSHTPPGLQGTSLGINESFSNRHSRQELPSRFENTLTTSSIMSGSSTDLPAGLELPSSGLNRGFACLGCR